MEAKLAEQLIKAAKIVEERLDNEISQLEKIDEDELETLRRKRVAEMKKAQAKKQEYLANGHGQYDELTSEAEFFEAAKKSDKLVCHFYLPTIMKCKVVDKLLEQLAKNERNYGTRFVKANAEKIPFLIKRLNIRVIPTIGTSINAKMCDYIRLATIERRLAEAGAIQLPPAAAARTVVKTFPKKTIRDSQPDDSDDDY
ncbi:Thioredoxin domain containing protein [Aphelenchoides avenae]|nr:Thioredoxin domain containing protein [Aphelenchus avenae]